MQIDRSSAWTHALAQYEKPDVANSCLFLQDEFGCNVNLILLCYYLDTQSYRLDAKALVSVEKAIVDSEVKLKHHRQLRRAAKIDKPENYRQLLEQELSLEKAQHTIMVESLNTMPIEPAENISASSSNLSLPTLMRYLHQRNLNDQQIDKYCDIISR